MAGSWISGKTRSPGAEEAGRGEIVLNRQGVWKNRLRDNFTKSWPGLAWDVELLIKLPESCSRNIALATASQYEVGCPLNPMTFTYKGKAGSMPLIELYTQ